MRRTARSIGNSLTLKCPCGQTYSGVNERLVKKLLDLHNKKIHNIYISMNEITMGASETLDMRTNSNNPLGVKSRKTIHERLQLIDTDQSQALE
jgi:hypothetical protein